MRLLLVLLFSLSLTLSAAAQTVGISVGNKAPELIGTTPSGEKVKLSDLTGKYVLIDFWASWCGPCRFENPNVVSAYNKFNNATFVGNAKGFEVFSISLDMKADSWKQAIETDKLSWKWHICDFGGWKSKLAAIYNIHQIPSNFLIDDKGIIVAVNLRGGALLNTLQQYVK